MTTPKQRAKFDLQLEPDAWQRFERAVDVVMKSPPQHRTKKKRKLQRTRSKKRT